MGAGDLGVGKRVKRMATGFYGRVAAYDEGQAKGDAREALRRNLFGTVSPAPAQIEAMAGYLSRAEAALAGQELPEILAGRPDFGRIDGRGEEDAMKEPAAVTPEFSRPSARRQRRPPAPAAPDRGRAGGARRPGHGASTCWPSTAWRPPWSSAARRAR